MIRRQARYCTLAALLAMAHLSVADEPRMPAIPECGACCVQKNNDNETIAPFVFRDFDSGVMFYVESNGRHISAIAPTGSVLWHRNPFQEAHLCAYRVSKPLIIGLEPWPGANESLVVRYNSSQFGTISKSTGEFRFLGQN